MYDQTLQQIQLGLIQMKCESDPEQNLVQALDRMHDAVRRGAQILCLQELFLSRYFCQTNNEDFFSLAAPIPNNVIERLASFAADEAVVVLGSFFEKAGNQYYNTAVVLDADGRFLGKYRKVHIPDDLPNYYSEKFYFSPGDLGFPVFQTRYAKLGMQVCWDQWFPEGARSLALQGAQIIFYPTAIGWPVGGDTELGQAEYDAWVTVQRGHAISNTSFVVAVNRTGQEDQLKFWGGSFVSDPFGKILQQASHDQSENLVVPIDLSQIELVRQDWPFLTCRRNETYQLK